MTAKMPLFKCNKCYRANHYARRIGERVNAKVKTINVEICWDLIKISEAERAGNLALSKSRG